MSYSQEYKGYNVVKSGEHNLKKITTIGKGSIPNELQGCFSSYGEAVKCIDLYLKRKGAKPNGTTK